jgi:MSHA biogenesis protein MshI
MRQQVNLYTAELRPRKQRLNARSALLLAALVVVVVLAFMAFGQWQVQKLEQRASQIERQNSQLQQAVDAMVAQVEARKPDPELEKALERVTQTISRRQRLLERVDSLANNNHSGFSSRMSALARQIPDELWLTTVTLESLPARLGLKGRTRAPERVPLYLEQLGEEPIFAGQTFRDFQLNRPDENDEAAGDWVEFRVATEPGEEASNE